MSEIEYHDVIVIGSGFGGSFVAHELAERGHHVCVLERGRWWHPGEFPRRPDELFGNVWAPTSGRYGLFDIRAFRGLTALVAAGVGGGSLIYANVMLRKPSSWFSTPVEDGESVDWPISRATLDPFYDRAHTLMDPKPFPYPGSIAPRAAAFEWAAGIAATGWTPLTSPSPSAMVRGYRSTRRPTCTARAAGSAGNASSAATSARRTRSTSRCSGTSPSGSRSASASSSVRSRPSTPGARVRRAVHRPRWPRPGRPLRAAQRDA